MTSPAKRNDRTWTWTDYRSWPDDERWEIVGGEAFAMAPAPSIAHQAVTGRIFARLERALAGGPCRPFVAPTDVRLSETDVVQPDILVVCDPGKIAPDCIDGAPEVVVEVLSPNTATRDLREKKSLYARCGVREYVIVDPLEHYATRFLPGASGQEAGFGAGDTFGGDELLPFATFAGLEIPLWEVFDLPAPGSLPPARGPGGAQ